MININDYPGLAMDDSEHIIDYEYEYQYLEHRREAGTAEKKAYMDIKAFRDAEKVEIILRNYDEPYNPLVFEREPESFPKIGVTMVQ